MMIICNSGKSIAIRDKREEKTTDRWRKSIPRSNETFQIDSHTLVFATYIFSELVFRYTTDQAD